MAKSGRYSADRKKIEELTAAKTVDVHDCGTLFMCVENGSGDVAVTLPAPASAGKGWWCKFILKTAAGNDIVISSPSANQIVSLELGALSGDADDTVNTLTMVGGTGAAGDQIELVCDGNLYYATCISSVDGGITASDV
jgi:hypothetical protein